MRKYFRMPRLNFQSQNDENYMELYILHLVNDAIGTFVGPKGRST